MKEINIPGMTTQVAPKIRPAACVFAAPNSGTTRLGTTMPTEGGYIAYLALDQNCRETLKAMKELNPKLPLIVNEEQFVSDEEAMKIVLRMGPDDKDSVEGKKKAEEKAEEAKTDYLRVMDKFRRTALNLVKSEAVTSVVIDKASQLYNWILYSRHGRSNQIQQLARAVPNQDMLDIINMIRTKKNLLLIHREKDVYKKTGVNKDGSDKTEKVTGAGSPEAMGNIEGNVLFTVRLTAKRGMGELGKQQDGEDDGKYMKRVMKQKYRAIVTHCKGNTLLEGTDLHNLPDDLESKLEVESDQFEGPGVSGLDITWENIALAIGIEED